MEHEEEIAPQVIELVLQLVDNGELSAERIFESRKRIQTLKK